MNNKLEMLKNKNIGRHKLEAYQALFKKFYNVKFINLEKSTEILNKVAFNKNFNEQLDAKSIFINSDLLREVYFSIDDDSKSYVFTNDFEYYGVFLVDTKEAIENALIIAKIDRGNTCFILDKNYLFYFKINYYNSSHADHPDTYNVQKSINK